MSQLAPVMILTH